MTKRSIHTRLVAFRLPANLKKQIDQAAAKRYVSSASWIRSAIIKTLQAER